VSSHASTEHPPRPPNPQQTSRAKYSSCRGCSCTFIRAAMRAPATAQQVLSENEVLLLRLLTLKSKPHRAATTKCRVSRPLPSRIFFQTASHPPYPAFQLNASRCSTVDKVLEELELQCKDTPRVASHHVMVVMRQGQEADTLSLTCEDKAG